MDSIVVAHAVTKLINGTNNGIVEWILDVGYFGTTVYYRYNEFKLVRVSEKGWFSKAEYQLSSHGKVLKVAYSELEDLYLTIEKVEEDKKSQQERAKDIVFEEELLKWTNGT